MEFTVLGLSRYLGEYQGYKYDKVRLHCTINEKKDYKKEDGSFGYGTFTEQVSFKYDGNLEKWIGLVGHKIRVYYDRYSNPCSYDVID